MKYNTVMSTIWRVLINGIEIVTGEFQFDTKLSLMLRDNTVRNLRGLLSALLNKYLNISGSSLG